MSGQAVSFDYYLFSSNLFYLQNRMMVNLAIIIIVVTRIPSKHSAVTLVPVMGPNRDRRQLRRKQVNQVVDFLRTKQIGAILLLLVLIHLHHWLLKAKQEVMAKNSNKVIHCLHNHNQMLSLRRKRRFLKVIRMSFWRHLVRAQH